MELLGEELPEQANFADKISQTYIDNNVNPIENFSILSNAYTDEIKLSATKRPIFTYPDDLFDHGASAFILFNIRSSNIKETKPSFGEVRLYMPASLRVNYGAQWEEMQLPLTKIGDLISSAGDTVKTAWDTISNSAGGGLKDLGKGILDALTEAAKDDAGKWMMYNLAKSVSPSLAGELLAGGTIASPGENAAAVNPYAALMFNSPAYRTLALDFEFYARNRNEAENIRKILKTFKMAMHPGKMESGDNAMFWDAPFVFEIFLFTPYLHNMFNFKKAALLDMAVDYGASGVQSFFKDGHPTHVKATLQFKELGLLTREDVSKNY